MGTSSLELSRTYTSFSGVDIRAIVDGVPIGQLQAISYAVQREKAPIYVMGKVDPLSFSRGKRGIAGTLISLMLDEHLLYSEPWKDKVFIADNDEVYPSVSSKINVSSTATDLENDSVDFTGSDLTTNWAVETPWYVDQVPPFDISIVAVNEYGKSATMRVYGVEILNEGSGFSIDDIVIENQMTYVCRAILPWQKLGAWSDGDGTLTSAATFSPVT
tara:strand:- start:137 stop:787 length:651 start_codon:yes stop_codon:yes gene_type:complete